MNMDYLKDHNILILKIKANGTFSHFQDWSLSLSQNQ